MSRESILITVGVLVALSPFSGLPHSWLAIILPFLGLVAGGIGYAMRVEHVRALRAGSGAALPADASFAAPVESHFHTPSRVA